MSITQRLADLGLTLPQPPQALGQYHPWVRTGDLIFVSGQIPLLNGVLKYAGKLGADLDDADGYQAAKLAGLNVLAQLHAATQQFETLNSIVRLDGHIQCVPNWYNHAGVLDGASDLFAQVLNNRAGHARTVFGQTTLPLNAAVELVVIASVRSPTKSFAAGEGSHFS
ncbi:RidA family protein [Nostoc sp. UHCC 0302]|uniref:RidA family protein n=1 Tax=Nostoc sp. UHCC 0302 TaxID=3134896 RepID=UPI00311C8B19